MSTPFHLTNCSASATAISISHTRFPYRLTTGNCCVLMLLLIFQERMQGPTPSAAPAPVNPQQTSVCDTLAISMGLPLFCVMHACTLSLSRGTHTRDHSLGRANYSASAPVISIPHSRLGYMLTSGNCRVLSMIFFFLRTPLLHQLQRISNNHRYVIHLLSL